MRKLSILRGLYLLFMVVIQPITPALAEAPSLLLAKVYHLGDPIDLSEYRVSEKFDGVRAYWDGHRLLSRQGNPIAAPSWFTADWPETAMDGELWGGHGRFEPTSGIVRSNPARNDQWRQIRYLIFDLPSHAGTFDQRIGALRLLVSDIGQPWVEAVEQSLLANEAELRTRLDRVISSGGEGLMLHRGNSLYRGGRSDDLLKLKPYDDAEAVVVAHIPGAGKYEGMMGSIVVERPDGSRFRIGTGFSDLQRRNPPPVGNVVTYTYRGITRTGLPRFASFQRIRQE